MSRKAADGTALKSWRVGDVKITRLDELMISSAPGSSFTGATAEDVQRNDWLRPHFVDEQGLLLMSFHSFVVESEGKQIMIDTCVGNDKARIAPFFDKLQTPFLDNLEAAGFAPDDFDYVLCTHLHVDHVGWNTRWTGTEWVPTFRNARYLFGRLEWESFSAAPDTIAGDILGDSIQPVMDAGLCDLVEADHRITGEIRLEHAPGHTPGHVVVRIESRGESAVITGDLMHHPIQCAEPHLASRFDEDPAHARTTREKFLHGCCGQPTLVLGSHFADPTAGWIVATDRNWRLMVERPEVAIEKMG